MTKVLRRTQACMTGRYFAVTLTAMGFLALAPAGQAKAQTVALDCANPILRHPVKIVIDYGHSTVSVYPDGDALTLLQNPYYLQHELPPVANGGDHVVHTASITDDYVKWSGDQEPGGLWDTMAPYSATVENATIDRKTGEFLVVFGVPMNMSSTQVGSCTKRSDTNKF